MHSVPDTKSISDLLELRKANMLAANPEYQRGEVWTLSQKKRLIDSVLRGYPIPLIYLHHIKTRVAGAIREDFEIIDGQQRITTLSDYKDGAFKLFDPVADAEEARFPSFILEQPCPWGGKTYDELDPSLQKQFVETKLSVVMIETNVSNEARDLFIRLQAGMPLNSQEKRDAWPGNFTELILKIGGKPQIAKYPGDVFFHEVMKAKAQRGEFRQLAAQMVMLYMAHRDSGGEKLCEINRDAIDTFYYKNLNLDMQSDDVKRFREILKLLTKSLSGGRRPKIIGHEALHLVLLVNSLVDEYTLSWVDTFAAAFDRFREGLALAKKSRHDAQPNEYWIRYGQLTRTNTDRADTIIRRHQFFAEKMYEFLNPKLKDPTRIYGALERELIYYRDKKKCQLPTCGGEVSWTESEIHHVEQHSRGGLTTMDNGTLMHKHCHPKGDKATSAFAEHWKKKNKGEGVAT
jgi:Protein of unknown function DUF262/HNH endonuclease